MSDEEAKAKTRWGTITRQYEASCEFCSWTATFGSLDPHNNIYRKAQGALTAHLESVHGRGYMKMIQEWDM